MSRKLFSIACLNDEGKARFGHIWLDGRVPILCAYFSEKAALHGMESPQDVYMINLRELTPGQLNLCVIEQKKRCPDIPWATIRKGILSAGLPLQRKWVSCTSTNNMFWLGDDGFEEDDGVEDWLNDDDPDAWEESFDEWE